MTAYSIFNVQQWERLGVLLRLTPKQQQVLKLLFEGKSDKQIALAMEISHSTVRNHLDLLYARFDLQDRTSLVLHVIQASQLDLESAGQD